ncbi:MULTISPECIES: TetR/AcrR family transcriptional regulator [Clostridium]|uniref:TetR/AcrR family transcriptional regulator n=1 Tax=Clostridium TaxID=1485 RepID=UPI0003F844B6|nr:MULTISPECIES: TetR/AcrR family transcriptional regulator [Clostridium]MBN7573403.1 TetR/AcrR family transcriptional regulator [Clostridium beijerinckii]MBN7578741.1 TetR/AcrR family transcriptional regulator [Clostridium beijerinckii]MBN7583176.1 TetR/AcrR family transcriptional regulator [Clostridium beijerinckii]MBO0519331.1 TetR/AcrR family transcriptional regulator [Clostridium beijerinckii]MZK49142.1 TetR family transcriptional regulator [Clostridium beijerinckii]
MTNKECSVHNTENIPQPDDNNSKSLRADAKQNREQILDAAYKIFSEKGTSIPISEIARQAGVGIGTVYRHFPNKEALFEAVNINYKQQLTKRAKSLINNIDPGEAFFNFFTHIIEDGFTNKALKDALNTGMTDFDVLQDFQSTFATLLTSAQQAKAVREDIDIKDLITLMMSLLFAIEQRKGDWDIERFNKLMSIVIDGLRYKDTNNKST